MAKFSYRKSTELRMAQELRKVARAIGVIIKSSIKGDEIPDPGKLAKALNSYSDAIEPWASDFSDRFLKDVSKSNYLDWTSVSKKFGKQLSKTLYTGEIGIIARQLHAEQVDLIKTLPLKAGLRAQELAQEAMTGGKRASVVAKQLAESEKILTDRATLIARTEIAKANALMTKVRAQSVGVVYYIWRTAEDADVRESHQAMANKIFRFDEPPEVEGEGRHNPGEIYNCRCYAEPIIIEIENL